MTHIYRFWIRQDRTQIESISKQMEEIKNNSNLLQMK